MRCAGGLAHVCYSAMSAGSPEGDPRQPNMHDTLVSAASELMRIRKGHMPDPG